MSKHKTYWEQYADTYQQVYELRYKYFLIPAITNFLGDVKNKHILDVGCGGGQVAKILTDKGAKLTGIDSSSGMIDIAQKSYPKIKFVCGDAESLNKHIRQKFDTALAIQFFLTINSKAKIRKIFRKIYNQLKPRGSFVFTDLHFYKRDEMDDFFIKNTFPKNLPYFSSGTQYDVVLKSGKQKMQFKDTFWNLSDYVGLIKEVGFVIEDIHEPKPAKNIPSQHKKKFAGYFNNPLYIFLKVRK